MLIQEKLDIAVEALKEIAVVCDRPMDYAAICARNATVAREALDRINVYVPPMTAIEEFLAINRHLIPSGVIDEHGGTIVYDVGTDNNGFRYGPYYLTNIGRLKMAPVGIPPPTVQAVHEHIFNYVKVGDSVDLRYGRQNLKVVYIERLDTEHGIILLSSMDGTWVHFQRYATENVTAVSASF